MSAINSMGESKRCWEQDGRILTAEDAEQCVQCYRRTYSPSRYRWLLELAVSNGHKPEAAAVFRRALQELPNGQPV